VGASSTLEDAPTDFNFCGLTWVYAAYVIFQEGYRASHNMIIQPGCAANASPKFGEVQADNENLELYFLSIILPQEVIHLGHIDFSLAGTTYGNKPQCCE